MVALSTRGRFDAIRRIYDALDAGDTEAAQEGLDILDALDAAEIAPVARPTPTLHLVPARVPIARRAAG